MAIAAPAPARGSVLIWDQIGSNKRKTWFLLGFFLLFAFAFIGVVATAFLGFNIPVLAIAGVGLILYGVFSYVASSRIVLQISGAHEVTKEEEWEYVRRVENLCIGAGLPMPKTWVLEDSAPNAFATGMSPKNAHVVVTRGLLDKLEPIELEGVLAHELSHVANYDIRVMTIVTVLVGVIALVADVTLRLTQWGAGSRPSGRGKGKDNAGVILLVIALVAAILAPIVAQAMRMSISRKREYLADASGAYLSRHPEALARALEKIAMDPEPLEAANKATAHLYISNPLREHGSWLNNLFETHPPIADRIRILRSM